MRSWPVLLALVLALPVAQAADEICTVAGPFGPIEYSCPSGDPEEDAPWWATNAFQAVLGVIGLVGSASAGAYTLYRVRTRRRHLSATLAAIESTYQRAKSDPDEGISRLAQLRADVRAQHDKGKLDDAHFLDLDKRASEYLVKLRLLEIDRRFAGLPPVLLAEIRRLLADGSLSQTEADLIEVRAAAYRISDISRAQLADITRRWAQDDAPILAAPVEAA